MREQIVLDRVNGTYLTAACSPSIGQELSERFSFEVPNAQWMPAVREGRWDGVIRLYNPLNGLIYNGLLDEIKQFGEDYNYDVVLKDSVQRPIEISDEELRRIIASFKLPDKLKIRDYQFDAYAKAIRDQNAIILCPTASGKSLIQYLIIRTLLQEAGLSKLILIVPTVPLVRQMYGDFKEYGWENIDDEVQMIFEGQSQVITKKLTISTWQSIYNKQKKWFSQFEGVLGDEVHMFQAKSLKGIMENVTNAYYRIGLTGTLDESKTSEMVLKGLFGPVEQITTTVDLINANYLSPFDIRCLLFSYDKNTYKDIWQPHRGSRQLKYQDEVRWLINNSKRNNAIIKLALSLPGNTIVLYRFVDQHGVKLAEKAKQVVERLGLDIPIFFVSGKTDPGGEFREALRPIVNGLTKSTTFASFKSFATGTNITNLHNIILAHPSKSKVQVLQSIGRVLRKSTDGRAARLWDIGDNLSLGKDQNATLHHMIKRVGYYSQQGFNFTTRKVAL